MIVSKENDQKCKQWQVEMDEGPPLIDIDICSLPTLITKYDDTQNEKINSIRNR